jgi:hypothetical protein
MGQAGRDESFLFGLMQQFSAANSWVKMNGKFRPEK